MPLIIDLCGGTGSWSKPYTDAGYEVRVIDAKLNMPVETYMRQVAKARFSDTPPEVRGVLAAPPCTEFSAAGAKHWNAKDPALLDAAVHTVWCIMEVITMLQPKWWALENPVGRIEACCPYIGRKRMMFDPWEYGDFWTKRTCLWGNFVAPPKLFRRKPFLVRDRVNRMSESSGRATLRSITPPGFAQAFFVSNP